MPTTSDIIKQLVAVLPPLTSKFSDTFIITSLTRSGSTVTAVTSLPHGFITGDFVNISGAIAPINVTSLALSGNIAIGLTGEDHDLTVGFQPDLEIVGADQAEYNGKHTPFDVPNRRTFSFEVTGTPASPATGSIFLFDGAERGYNGRFEITVTGTNVVTYTINTTPISPAFGNIIVNGNIRISGGAEIDSTLQAYSKQLENDSWLFVVRGPGSVTKNRQLDNDATYTPAAGIDYRQQFYKAFDVYWVTPTTNQISGRQASDESVEIEKLLVKALCGVNFIFLFDETCDYLMASTGERLHLYNGSYYVHEFSFEISGYITQGDVVEPGLNVAFRDIELSVESEIAGETSSPLTVDIDLDDEPLD